MGCKKMVRLHFTLPYGGIIRIRYEGIISARFLRAPLNNYAAKIAVFLITRYFSLNLESKFFTYLFIWLYISVL